MFQAKASKECLDVVKYLMPCKPKPRASICAFVLEMKGYFNRLKSLNMVFDAELSINIILSGLPADYNQFVLSYQMNEKETSIMELHSLLQTVEQGINKIDVPSTLATPGLKESRRLKHGELNLVMGNRKITLVTRIGKYELMLKSGVRIDLNNSSPCKGIYETVECISHNGNVILNVGSSNELDKSKLWHSCLGHVNKKHIAQLQKDGVLSDDVCDLDNSTSNVLIPLDSWTSGLLVYKLPLSEDKISDSTLSELDEPANYKEAMASHEAVKLKEAMKSKIQSMYDNQVWNLVDTTPGLRWWDVSGSSRRRQAWMGKYTLIKLVAKIKSIRIMLAITAFHDYEIWQMDVKTAFLNEKLTEDVFIAQPEGFENKFGFSRSEDESYIYVKVSGSVVVFLVLYVDDILLIENDIPMLQSVKDWLGKCFAMKDLGDAAYILGIKIYKDRSKLLIGLSQDTKDLCPKTDIELDRMSRVPYASAVGSIMYAMTCTRPDVSFALSMVSRHQKNPYEGHWTVVENILNYLRNTKDRFLVYGREEELRVTGYYDASWQQIKMIVVHSLVGKDPIEIFYDNESTVALTKEPKDHKKSKHIERKYHFVRSKVEERHVIVKHIRLEDNPADPFTKALAKSRHDEHARSI
ncbi:retrotransposon protein, putative, ty1-copia subclass [Tanacetum coccineum]